MRRTVITVVLSSLLIAGASSLLQAHESPVDLVGRKLRMWIEGDWLRVRYEEQLSERSALLELHVMDLNRDGTIQDDERSSYLTDKARLAAERLQMRLDDTPIALTPLGPVECRQGWRQVYDFRVALTNVTTGTHALRLTNRYSNTRPGAFQWAVGRPVELVARGVAPGRATLRAKPKPPSDTPYGDDALLEVEFQLDMAEGVRQSVP